MASSRDVTSDVPRRAEAPPGGFQRRAGESSQERIPLADEPRAPDPFNSVLGFAELLELDELLPKQQEAVEHILRAGRHLLGLIDEVLDIARIEMGHLDMAMESVEVRVLSKTRSVSPRH